MKMKREIHTIFNVHILRGNQRNCKANYSNFCVFEIFDIVSWSNSNQSEPEQSFIPCGQLRISYK